MDTLKEDRYRMYEGCAAQLRMERGVLQETFLDETVYQCKVIAYDEEGETLYLAAEDANLTSFSLDGIYECGIDDEKESLICKGLVKERYWNKAGKVLRFKIQNGFYKKVLN